MFRSSTVRKRIVGYAATGVRRLNTFEGNPLDRASNLRRQAGWVDKAFGDPAGRFLAFHDLRVLMQDSSNSSSSERKHSPVWLPRTALSAFAPAGDSFDSVAARRALVFLGLDGSGSAAAASPSPRWAIDVTQRSDPLRNFPARFADLRNSTEQPLSVLGDVRIDNSATSSGSASGSAPPKSSMSAGAAAADSAAGGGLARFTEVRSAAQRCSGADAAVLAQARAMLYFVGRHRHCSVCGARNKVTEGGYALQCSGHASTSTTGSSSSGGSGKCDSVTYPRSDPVVIMLVEDTARDRVLLGRQKMWVKDTFSALAGFMEPGESFDEAVRREVFEESGVRVGRVRCVSSQPWPFPLNIMVGCYAEALSTDIHIDEHELESARWIPRAELSTMFARATVPPTDTSPGLRLAAPEAIAHQLAKQWLEEGKPVFGRDRQ